MGQGTEFGICILEYADDRYALVKSDLQAIPMSDPRLTRSTYGRLFHSIPKRPVDSILRNRKFSWSATALLVPFAVEIPYCCDEPCCLAVERLLPTHIKRRPLLAWLKGS